MVEGSNWNDAERRARLRPALANAHFKPVGRDGHMSAAALSLRFDMQLGHRPPAFNEFIGKCAIAAANSAGRSRK
jgi:hypothetical protein